MIIRKLNQVPALPVQMDGVQDAVRQLLIGKADGAPNFSLRVFTLQPGGYTPHHAHPFEHVNYILEGEGTMMSDEGPRKISKGDYLLILPNERHQFRNTGDEALQFICLVTSDYE